jgi:hypothetical protein
MKRLYISQYILLFMVMILSSIFIHYQWILPMLSCFITNEVCRIYIHVILVSIIEPIVCILIDIMLISRKQNQLLESY